MFIILKKIEKNIFKQLILNIILVLTKKITKKLSDKANLFFIIEEKMRKNILFYLNIFYNIFF